MLCITLDTCVWLELLKVDFNNEDNFFEEICFWIENNYIKHIVPTNIIDEWNRNKLNNQKIIISSFRKLEVEKISLFKNNKELQSSYSYDAIEINVQKRIERIDRILNSYSEKAVFDDDIIKEAANRNLKTLAPNHKKDSFRDTVNILSLIAHLVKHNYTSSIFTTINYKDFAADNAKKYELHEHLSDDFKTARLTYIFFDENSNFGTRLFNELRTTFSLPSFQNHLKEKREKEEAAILAEKKINATVAITNPDADYLENIKHIDLIIAKSAPTAFEQEMIKLLLNSHDSYKQYFFSNLGNNGMV